MSEAEPAPPAAEESCEGAEPQTSESFEGAKTSRELKSILALSREARLDTNLSPHRRKPKKGKITGFPVTAESELECEAQKEAPKKKGAGESGAEGAAGEDARKGAQAVAPDFVMPRKPNKDIFCWRCHHDCVQIACETCPRAYHLKCLKQTIMDMEHWPCPECVSILKAENTQTRSKAMKGMSLEHLCSLLKFAVKRMIQCNGSEPFIHPVDEKQFPEYRSYIVQPMTLTMLEKNIKDNLYGSTQAFEADAKWILHNSIVFNSYQSKLTTAAKTIVKICKQEMAEIENCPSCYLNANTKKHTWFVEVCPKPHLLVWAKLKGFPYWPAKVMSISASGMADVRFFGAHDKAWVSVKDCYLYSVKDPNSGKQKRNDIIECVKELELYVDNLREIYGRVDFAPFKTALEADSQLRQLQVFLPTYGSEEGKEAAARRAALVLARAAKGGSEENSSGEGEEGTEESEESEEDEEEEEEEEVDEEEEEEKKGRSDEGSMTRIDYRDSPSDKPKPIAKPIKAILIRKRSSVDNINDSPSKTPKHDDSITGSVRLSLDNHINVKTDENAETVSTSTDDVSDEKQSSPSQSKTKIADQLMKKLEDIDENVEDSTKEQETTENISTKDDEIKEVPEKQNSEQKEETASEKTEEKLASVEDKEEGELTEEEESDKNTEKDKVEEEVGTFQEKEKVSESDETKISEESEKNEVTKEMEVEVDPASIHNIIHSSLAPPPEEEVINENQSSKKRKREDSKEESEKEKVEEESNLFPPNKMVKLVPIENILQKKNEILESNSSNGNKQEQLIVLKEIRVVKDGKEVKNKTKSPADKTTKSKESTSVKIKNEIESDDEDSDVQYMEAKRQYLSALNISEKQKAPIKPKAHEIRTRSKTEEKKSKNTDNLSKSVAETPNRNNDTPNKTPTEPIKEIYIKSLSKMQTPKHKARKSFPTPNYNNNNNNNNSTNKKTIVARKIVPKTSNPIDDELTIVNAATLQPTGNVMILPKLHYNKPITINNRDLSSPPVLTMLPRPSAPDASTSAAAAAKRVAAVSQNYIPQNEEEDRAGAGTLLNNLLSGGGGPPPPVVDLDGCATGAVAQGAQADGGELGALKEILPENVTKGVSEILCQPPPKLRPKPVGILNSVVGEAGVPSTAGPVASRVNAMAQKLSDYFRGLLVETITDLGKSNNPEATISSLKYEIEELNHKHSIELSEIRRNVSIVLKDIQKSVVEERERIINETKANCEMEMMKKVEEAKSKQWCANCSKEAQFYCCWNTSYCDYPCQQKHWIKHMSKCTQTQGQNQTTSTPVRPAGQQLVLTPTSAPKFGTLFAKPQKVYLKRTTTPFKPTTGSHITLVESTPGNFELLGSGPIAVNGKILASTSVIEKIKCGNIVTVTAPSGTTNTQLSSVNQKVNPIAKSTSSSSESEH